MAKTPRRLIKGVKKVVKKALKKASPKKPAAKKPAAKKVARKAPPKKAAPRKAPPKKAVKAPVKAAKKLPPPKKAAVKAPAKAAKAAPAKAAKPAPKPAPAAATAPAPAPAAPTKGKPGRPPKVPPAPAPATESAAATATAVAPPGAGLPKKRGRKRRDPLEDLLRPDKPKRRPGRPRKRTSLVELIPKRPRLRKRVRGRRSEDDEGDVLVAPRPPAPRDTMSIEEIRKDVLTRYLRGESPACPVGCGGMAQVVRISTGENGAGEIWLECLSCAQRERFEVTAPTSQERDAVFATLEAGNEPTCPRHGGRWVPLRRRGRDLVCPECGVLIQGR